MSNCKILLIAFVLVSFSFSAMGKENSVRSKFSYNRNRLLFIGDSHSVGVFGHTLTTLMQENFPKVVITAIASCGSDSDWWLEGKMTHCGLWTHYPNGFEHDIHKAKTPKLSELLHLVKPKITIVALGSNLVPLSEEERISSTEEMMMLIEKKGGQCIWIGAPDSRKFKAADINNVYLTLKKLSKKHHCKLIDSRKYTKYPALGGDGLHYGGKEGALIATQWAEKVFVNTIKPALSKKFGTSPQYKKIK